MNLTNAERCCVVDGSSCFSSTRTDMLDSFSVVGGFMVDLNFRRAISMTKTFCKCMGGGESCYVVFFEDGVNVGQFNVRKCRTIGCAV